MLAAFPPFFSAFLAATFRGRTAAGAMLAQLVGHEISANNPKKKSKDHWAHS